MEDLGKEMYELSWMDNKVESVPVKNNLYKFICFISFRKKRKFTFKELFLIIRNLNKNLGEVGSFNVAFYKILKMYKYQYNEYPKGFVEKNDRA